MANIRVSAAVTTVLSVATSAAVASVSVAAPYVQVSPVPVNPIRASVFVVPMEFLEEQTVVMSDFRAFAIGQVTIDIALATEDMAMSVDKVLTDEVTANDASFRAVYGSIDFDPSDDDVDPDPITLADTDTKGFGKVLTDSSIASETDVKSVGKAASDSVTSSEAINTKHVGKSLSDTAAAADEVNTFAIARVSTDSVTSADTVAKTFTRPNLADSAEVSDTSFRSPELAKSSDVTPSDAVNSFDIGKNPSDTATPADAITSFDVAAALADTVTMTDTTAKTFVEAVDYDRNDTDVDPDPVAATDVMAKDFTRPDITDTAVAADDNAKTVNTVRTDIVSMADALISSPAKVLTDSAIGSDAAALSPGKVTTDTVTVADVLNSLNPIKVSTDSVTGVDVVNIFAVTKGLSDSVTMAESIATELILGQTTAFYPDYVSMDDGSNFVFHRYRTSVPDYSEVLGGSDSLFNSTYMQNANDGLTYENYTGIIGGPGLMLTAPLINGEFITYGYSTGAGLVVNFHYTDAADRTVGGYQFNQTPIL
jgi:hypothetical protein